MPFDDSPNKGAQLSEIFQVGIQSIQRVVYACQFDDQLKASQGLCDFVISLPHEMFFQIAQVEILTLKPFSWTTLERLCSSHHHYGRIFSREAVL